DASDDASSLRRWLERCGVRDFLRLEPIGEKQIERRRGKVYRAISGEHPTIRQIQIGAGDTLDYDGQRTTEGSERAAAIENDVLQEKRPCATPVATQIRNRRLLDRERSAPVRAHAVKHRYKSRCNENGTGPKQNQRDSAKCREHRQQRQRAAPTDA